MPEERRYFSRSSFVLGSGQGPAELTLECVPTTWLTLRYLEADGETGVGGLPWRVTFDNGTVREGELDRHGEAYLTEVPTGPVEVEFSPAEEEDEARLAELRAELKAALDAEVARAQSEGEMYAAQMAKTAWYEKPFIYTGAALVGTWEWIEDTAEGLYTLAESGLSTAFHSAQWVTQYTMHMDALNRAFVRGDEREVRIQARALNQMMQEVQGALKADLDQLQDLSLLAWDDETREMLVDFPVRYFKALDAVSSTRMVFRHGIDAIIIVVGLAAGGAGIAWGVLKFGSRAANITKKMIPILKRLRHRKTVREPDVNRRVEIIKESRPPKKLKTRLPRTNGHWEGKPGDGLWYSDIVEVNKVTKGKPIEFRNGRPVFSPWAKGSLKFKPGELNGSTADFDLVYDYIAKKKGFGSRNRARIFLKEKGLTPHHVDGTTIELVPTDLHGNIPHIGSASDLRGTP